MKKTITHEEFRQFLSDMCDKHIEELENSNPEKELSIPVKLAIMMTLMLFSAQLCAELFEDDEKDTIELTEEN